MKTRNQMGKLRSTVRRAVNEAIYLDDYRVSRESLVEFAHQVRKLADHATSLGLSKTADSLRSLVYKDEPNEWWQSYLESTRVSY